jgi:hypothetical protein
VHPDPLATAPGVVVQLNVITTDPAKAPVLAVIIIAATTE